VFIVMLLKLRQEGLGVGALCARACAKSREDSARHACNIGTAGEAAAVHTSGGRHYAVARRWTAQETGLGKRNGAVARPVAVVL
jgi:hypothetical protein